MPVVSKAQNAAMHAAAAGKSTLGIPKSVGAEFTADQAPGSVKKLPQRVKKNPHAHMVDSLKKRGLIGGSTRAVRKVEDRYGGKDEAPIDAATR